MPRINPIQRCRAIGPRRGVAMAASLVPPAQRIVSVTDGATDAIYTTAAPHGLLGDAAIAITGVSPPEYNTTEIPIPTGATTFTMPGISFTTLGSGGRWVLV